ncbi:MAG: NAD(P)H-dependent oxidoreductase [Deltaproteobacteria bacterium]|nr:NAD(P)H-dependent oxidoreductase [Deltaproteobacteria bacterium]
MRLTVFNGSPRTRRGNTALLLGDLLGGFVQTGPHTVEVHYLNSDRRRRAAAEAFGRSEAVLLAFPLYMHAMPGIVMTWLELLEPLDPSRQVRMGCIVQGGLPEARQSSAVAAFLGRLPGRLGCVPAGTVVRGGVEAMRFAPAFMFRRLRRHFTTLGRQLGTAGRFDDATIAAVAGHETMPAWRRGLFRILEVAGLSDRYWVTTLRENHALEHCFDRPYAPGSASPTGPGPG